MATTSVHEPLVPETELAPPAPSTGGTIEKGLAGLEEIAGIVVLAGGAIRALISAPSEWWREFVEEAWSIVKRCLPPVVFCTFMFGFGGPGVNGSNILNIFGTVDRLGAFFVAVSVREFAPWINGMIIAGIAGTAICADLGARKVRDEIEALSSLGLDPVTLLVAPRFLALGVVTPLMNLVAMVSGIVGGWGVSVIAYGEATGGYVSTLTSNFTLVDLIGSVIKTMLMGFVIAAVCCYKGMRASGGAEGVGRAVNQAVVLAFVGVWVLNSLFVAVMLAAFPETANLH